MKPTLPFAQYDADIDHLHILHKAIPDGVTNLYTEEFVRQLQAEIEALKKYFKAWMFLNNGMIELGTKARSIIKEKQNDYSE